MRLTILNLCNFFQQKNLILKFTSEVGEDGKIDLTAVISRLNKSNPPTNGEDEFEGTEVVIYIFCSKKNYRV